MQSWAYKAAYDLRKVLKLIKNYKIIKKIKKITIRSKTCRIDKQNFHFMKTWNTGFFCDNVP